MPSNEGTVTTTTTTGAADDSAASAASTTDTGSNPTEKSGNEAAGAADTAITYDLKLPEGSNAPSDLVERMTAIARESGLTNDQAQKQLDTLVQESTALANTRAAETLAELQPPSDENPEGGAKWRETESAWRAAALADKELGNGNPDTLKAVTERVNLVLAKYGDQGMIDFLHKTGLGSNPATLKFLDKIAKASSEDTLVIPKAQSGEAKKSLADVLYPGMKTGYAESTAA